jgi:LMBR1 domain-containing protein 1
MSLLWEITYLAVLAYVVLLIPFAIFYYEADDGQGNLRESMFCQAFKYELAVLIISTLTLLLMYFFLGELGGGGGG